MKRKSIICALLLLSACSRVGQNISEQEINEVSKNTITSCSSDKNEKYTFFASDDEIYSMQEVFYMSYEEAGIYDEMSEDEVKALINTRLSDKYSPISGVSAIVDEVADYQIKIIFMIDFEQADFEQLAQVGLINEGEVQSQYISLKKTREEYSDNGFVCEVQ